MWHAAIWHYLIRICEHRFRMHCHSFVYLAFSPAMYMWEGQVAGTIPRLHNRYLSTIPAMTFLPLEGIAGARRFPLRVAAMLPLLLIDCLGMCA